MSAHHEIWLIRHGETEWTLSGAHTSRTDLPLTAEGERKAAALKPILQGKQFALVLSSPMQRARNTSKLAGFDPEIDRNLCEWDYGEYEGLTTPVIQRNAPGWSIWTSTPPGRGIGCAGSGSRGTRDCSRASGGRRCGPVRT